MISKNNATMLEEQGSSLHQRFTWFLPLFLPIIFCLGILSCEQESITDTDISLKKEKPKIDPVFQNIVDFSKELNNEVISRSNETYTPEELEVLVEGSINYLHTKPAIVDNSPEFYIDSTVTTLVGKVMIKIPLHRYTKT